MSDHESEQDESEFEHWNPDYDPDYDPEDPYPDDPDPDDRDDDDCICKVPGHVHGIGCHYHYPTTEEP